MSRRKHSQSKEARTMPPTSAVKSNAVKSNAVKSHTSEHVDPVLQTISRAAFALVMLFAMLLLWRGHNAPGGGFIAGLMTVCALILHRIANGTSALRVKPLVFIPWGLALSFVTGLVPYLLGKPYLKSDFGYITTPLTGEFEWATALLFDLGVYLVVVGGALHIAYALIDVNPHERVEDDA